MTISHHPDDPRIEGAIISAGHVREDLAEAAREYFRPLTSAELDDVTREMTARVEMWDDQADPNHRSLFYMANELLLLFSIFSHDH